MQDNRGRNYRQQSGPNWGLIFMLVLAISFWVTLLWVIYGGGV